MSANRRPTGIYYDKENRLFFIEARDANDKTKHTGLTIAVGVHCQDETWTWAVSKDCKDVASDLGAVHVCDAVDLFSALEQTLGDKDES